MIKIIPNKNARKITVKVDKITPEIKKGINTALFEIGSENTQQVKKYIYSPPKTGRWYRYKNRMHRASAPGQSPANRSGYLARSIDYKVRDWYEVEIFSTAKYAYWLEEGTTKMLPRPYFIRAKNKKARDNLRSLEKHVFSRIKT